MRVVQINAIYGSKSTGTIMREIQVCSEANGIDAYTAFSTAGIQGGNKGYRIGNWITVKWAALFSRVLGKQAYANRITTRFFLRWLDEIKPDVVHLHNLHSNYIHLNMLLRYLAAHDIATVITMHDCWYYTGGCTHYSSVGCFRWMSGCGKCPLRRKFSFFFDQTSYVLKDRVRYLTAIPRLNMVGVSEWIANEMKKSLLKDLNITFIHNGFNLSIFTPTVTKKRIECGVEDKYLILGPASKWLHPINKPTLEYFVSHMTYDMVMVLFGSTKSKLDLPSNIIQLKYINNPGEMAEVYSMADVMVNCSREDTLSSINLECQACGTPVITYDATGCKETVNEKCGFSVPTGNEVALWEKVLDLKARGKASFSKECIKWIQTHFDNKRNYKRYVDLYKMLVQN